jgi:predicted Holliday junction resolvase-like endonuclease
MNKYIIVLIIIVCLVFIYYYYYNKVNIIKNEVDVEMRPIYTQERFSNKIVDDFIASNSFQGSKKGYIFKTDDKGLGYYIDKN